LSGLFNELKRRNVVRVGIAYILIAWLIAQVAELALDSFDDPTGRANFSKLNQVVTAYAVPTFFFNIKGVHLPDISIYAHPAISTCDTIVGDRKRGYLISLNKQRFKWRHAM